MLSGYKTYIVAALVLALAVVEGALGWDVPGAEIPAENWLPWALNALGIGTMRAGIAKAAWGAARRLF